MIVKRLRSTQGITALKGETAWTNGDGAKIAVLPNGDYVVSRYDIHVRLPAAWCYAEVEPGMPKADHAAHVAERDADVAAGIMPEPKRGPGRPTKVVPA